MCLHWKKNGLLLCLKIISSPPLEITSIYLYTLFPYPTLTRLLSILRLHVSLLILQSEQVQFRLSVSGQTDLYLYYCVHILLEVKGLTLLFNHRSSLCGQSNDKWYQV